MATMEGFKYIKSKIFFIALIFFIAGVVCGNFFIWPWLGLLGILALSIIGVIFFKKFNQLACIFVLFFLLGIARYQISLPDCSQPEKICSFTGTTQKFKAQVKKVTSAIGYQNLVLESQGIAVSRSFPSLYQREGRGGFNPVSGLLTASAPLYPEFAVGDELLVSCKLEKYNNEKTEVGYANYLFKENIFVVCRGAQLSLIEKAKPGFFSLLDNLRRYFRNRLSASIGEPAGAVMSGMLLNETKEIPPDLNLLFANLGLTHIVAISGSHIVVVMSIISAILMWLGISRPRAFWPAVGAVIFYVLLVSSPASAVRSAIMAIVVMYTVKIGRLSSVGNALLFSATLMILVNPKILLFDVGFQLSFVSVCGLAYIGPRLAEKLNNLPEFGPIKEIVIATFSAQIMVWPLTIYYFGNFSIISLLANLLILPIVPLMMTWGIINLAVSAIWLQAGIWFGLVSYFLVGYWITVAELLAKIPGAYWKIGEFAKLSGFFIYLLLAWFFLRAKHAIIKR